MKIPAAFIPEVEFDVDSMIGSFCLLLPIAYSLSYSLFPITFSPILSLIGVLTSKNVKGETKDWPKPT